ncbi:acyl-CoA dehydrogenase family protein [Paenibacillus sp. NEAU-GSW1]|uniref:acyl-CoA dehydrogenase family protein n=1 Tax=Paenibacillus sp. NEAU-GSW1 TaxID=2682486 RepID=UPI0012E19BE0|nr:acyl-CoA dehydrogenase family protein [Paenibacillus sp. NEAU-GSW1]MUT66239.1 acyl-CoA dehydrogenase [Paenibacillus sp. NEAU-GSW1]
MTATYAKDPFIRNDREAAIAARSDRLAVGFAERASGHDREGSFPFQNFADLSASGYTKLTVPEAYGGEEASLYELVLAQDHLARGDGSTALAVGWHLGQLLQLRITRAWPEQLYAELCGEVVLHGAYFNNYASERATGSPSRGGRPETAAVRCEGGWLINGRKTFSTLSPIATHFTVTAWVEEEQRVGEFLVRMGDGITIEETWNTMGMRATGSHDLLLNDVFIAEAASAEGAAIRPAAIASDYGGALLHIPACYIGIAHAARDFAIQFAKEYRPNSLNGGSIAELPNIQRQLGELEAELITARTLLYSVADRWDKDPSGRESLRPELGLAKYAATNGALRIVDLAMRVVGGTSLSRTLPLERMYRDVRAGLHNPPMDDVVLTGLAKRALL